MAKPKTTIQVYPHNEFSLSVTSDTGEIKTWTFTYDEDLNLLFANHGMSNEEAADIARFIVAHTHLEELPPFDSPDNANAWTEESFFAFYKTVQLPTRIKKVTLDQQVTMSFSGLSGFGQFSFTPIENIADEWQEKYIAEQAAVSPHPVMFTAMNEIVSANTLCEAWTELFKLIRRSSDYRVKPFTKTMTMRQLLTHLEPDTSLSEHALSNCFKYQHIKGTAYLHYMNNIDYKGYYASVTLHAGRAFLKQLLSDVGMRLEKDRFGWLYGEEEDDAWIVKKTCYSLITKMLEIYPASDHMVVVTLKYKVLEKLPWAE